MVHDVAIVGAGVAGLTLARALSAAGQAPLVLERSRGVGGRCATRRLDTQVVDHGVGYLHGRSPAFVAALRAVEDVTRHDGWPLVRDGHGAPCRPEAFDEDSYRVAFAEGVNRFPKWLARGLAIRTDATVSAIGAPDGRAGWRLSLASGDEIRARTLVLTMPAASALQLLETAGPLPEAAARVQPLVALVRSLPCLTVIARYPFHSLDAPWQASLPHASDVLQTVFHDSSKRVHPDRLMLVLQARPGYSRPRTETPPDTWTAEMLAEAGRLYGHWVAHPEFVQAHVWRKARVTPGTELSSPVVATLGGGERLAFAGDGFHPAGGVEGAYLSALALAARLTGDAIPHALPSGVSRVTDPS